MTTRTTTILIVIAAIAILGAAIYNITRFNPILKHSEITEETLKR